MYSNYQLTRFRLLLNQIRHLTTDVSQVAIIGECELPSAHVIYYFDRTDYKLALRTTHSGYDSRLLEPNCSDAARQLKILRWIKTYADKELAENSFDLQKTKAAMSDIKNGVGNKDSA
jgi:hypothetical protein